MIYWGKYSQHFVLVSNRAPIGKDIEALKRTYYYCLDLVAMDQWNDNSAIKMVGMYLFINI